MLKILNSNTLNIGNREVLKFYMKPNYPWNQHCMSNLHGQTVFGINTGVRFLHCTYMLQESS